MSEEREAIEELKKLGINQLISLQRKQRAVSFILKDTTGEAEKRDKRINIALQELGQ